MQLIFFLVRRPVEEPADCHHSVDISSNDLALQESTTTTLKPSPDACGASRGAPKALDYG